MTDTSEKGTSPRRRGRPPRIGPSQILEVAKTLPPESLTIQAIADALGVDRRAIGYHIDGREQLFGQVAASALASELAKVPVSPTAPWQDVVRQYAHAVRTSMLATGKLATYVRFDTGGDTETLRAADRVFARLLAAGFSPEIAGRGLTMVVTLALAYVRDEIIANANGSHPQYVEVMAALAKPEADELPSLRAVVSSDGYISGVEMLDFGVTTILRGLEQYLPTSAEPASDSPPLR